MNLNKGISTPIAFAIIIVLALLVVGGVLGYQYYWVPKEKNKTLDDVKEKIQTFPPKQNMSFEDKKAWHEILKWPNDCKFVLEAEDFKDSLIFDEIAPNKYLVSIICHLYAYQGEYAFMIFDENADLFTSKLLYLDTYDTKNNSIIKGSWSNVGDASFYRDSKELRIFLKGRGLGDCGEYKIYDVHENGTVILKEYRTEDCVTGNSLRVDDWKVYYDISLSDKNLFSEEKSETAGWETYTNSEYGFEFKYPNDYTLSERTEDNLFFKYYPARVVGIIYKDDLADSNIYISADSTASSVNQCLQNNLGIKNINGANWYIISEKSGDVAMGGERGITTNYKIVYNGGCFEIIGFVHYRVVGYGGVINTGKSDATLEETKAQNDSIAEQSRIIDKILSTFRLFVTTEVSIDSNNFDLVNKSFGATTRMEKQEIKVLTTSSTKFYSTQQGVETNNFTFSEFYSLIKNWVGPSSFFRVKGVLEEQDIIEAEEVFYFTQE